MAVGAPSRMRRHAGQHPGVDLVEVLQAGKPQPRAAGQRRLGRRVGRAHRRAHAQPGVRQVEHVLAEKTPLVRRHAVRVGDHAVHLGQPLGAEVAEPAQLHRCRFHQQRAQPAVVGEAGQVQQHIEPVVGDALRQLALGQRRHRAPGADRLLQPLGGGVDLVAGGVGHQVHPAGVQCREHGFQEVGHRVVRQIARQQTDPKARTWRARGVQEGRLGAFERPPVRLDPAPQRVQVGLGQVV